MDWYGVVAIAMVTGAVCILIGHAFGYIKGRDDEDERHKKLNAERARREAELERRIARKQEIFDAERYDG